MQSKSTTLREKTSRFYSELTIAFSLTMIHTFSVTTLSTSENIDLRFMLSSSFMNKPTFLTSVSFVSFSNDMSLVKHVEGERSKTTSRFRELWIKREEEVEYLQR